MCVYTYVYIYIYVYMLGSTLQAIDIFGIHHDNKQQVHGENASNGQMASSAIAYQAINMHAHLYLRIQKLQNYNSQSRQAHKMVLACTCHIHTCTCVRIHVMQVSQDSAGSDIRTTLRGPLSAGSRPSLSGFRRLASDHTTCMHT